MKREFLPKKIASIFNKTSGCEAIDFEETVS